MLFVELVALLAVFQYFAFGALVGRARGQYGVKAPAVSGHAMFERAYRVQMNTLELLVLLLPGLYLASKHWAPGVVAAIGAVYLVGRTLYWQAYLRDPQRRGLGFILSMGPIQVLLFASLFSVIKGLL